MPGRPGFEQRAPGACQPAPLVIQKSRSGVGVRLGCLDITTEFESFEQRMCAPHAQREQGA